MAKLFTFIFQSTLPRGSDSQTHWQTDCLRRFQSTLPRGSDYFLGINGAYSRYFNPRSLAGATSLYMAKLFTFIFQSTLPRGSDVNTIIINISIAISIHAPSRERLRGGSQAVPIFCHFNPRSLAGATMLIKSKLPAR